MSDEIDEMSAASRGSVAHGWVSIDDALPPQGERVLFFLDDPGPTEVSIGWWEGKRTHGKAIVMEYGDEDGDWLPCSHWMTLPAPPTDSK